MPLLKKSLGLRAALLSLLIFAGIVVLWQIATQPPPPEGLAPPGRVILGRRERLSPGVSWSG